jgi:hypothetical protein
MTAPQNSTVKKIVVRDITEEGYEPYDRPYILDEVAGLVSRSKSILRNAGMTTVYGHGYKAHRKAWDTNEKPCHYVCFEIDEITDAKWEFLENSILSIAVKLEVLPDDTEVTVHYPSQFAR